MEQQDQLVQLDIFLVVGVVLLMVLHLIQDAVEQVAEEMLVLLAQ
jgi:hypothetical protein